MNVYDVVRKLIGEIEPIGENDTDDVRFKNLKAMTDLVDSLLIDIEYIATVFNDNFVYSRNSPEYTRSRAGQLAYSFLEEMGTK